jgi:hypothetical protein
MNGGGRGMAAGNFAQTRNSGDLPPSLKRRVLLGAVLALVTGTKSAADEIPSVLELSEHPSLRRFYNRAPGTVDAEGRAGLNIGNYNIIEEQRLGAEWILIGRVLGRPEWVAQGWRILDYGISKQAVDGGFGSEGYLHANALFVEALARACLVDPIGASEDRKRALDLAARWLMKPSRRDLDINAPFTHRRYILAAALGQAAAVANTPAAVEQAKEWAEIGLSLQRADGVNPELGSFDVSYQFVGPLHACRYLTVCPDARLRFRLKDMIQRAINWEGPRIKIDGTVDVTGSSRIGRELYGEKPKIFNIYDAYEALIYSAELVDPSFFGLAARLGHSRGW